MCLAPPTLEVLCTAHAILGFANSFMIFILVVPRSAQVGSYTLLIHASPKVEESAALRQPVTSPQERGASFAIYQTLRQELNWSSIKSPFTVLCQSGTN